MVKIDLHLHTHYSDGECSPEDVLKEAYRQGIHAFAITDHNYLHEHTPEFLNRAKEKEIDVIQGIEVSTFSKSLSLPIHLLGYSRKFNISEINQSFAPIVSGYKKRGEMIIAHLEKKYPGIQFRSEKLSTSPYMSRNAIASLLVEYHSGKISFNDAMKEAYVAEQNDWMSEPKDIISIIKRHGGISALAHPGRIIEAGKFPSVMDELLAYGLDGVEAYYPFHDKDVVRRIAEFAKEKNILITGGSDWHGKTYSSGITLGQDVPQEDWEALKNAIERFVQ